MKFEIRTVLDATVDEVWAHATSPDGVAYELAPWLKMTFPAEVRQLDETTVPIGRRLCRSWLLVFGFLPLDYDDVTIVELDPPRRFLERSPMASIRVWQHERIVEEVESGVAVTDRLEAEPRLFVPAFVVGFFVRFLFRHRHRRLAASFARG